MKRSITFMVACHDRLDVFKVFCLNVEELRKDFDVTVTLCTSDIKVMAYATDKGFICWYSDDNKPIGKKRNQAVKLAMGLEDKDLYINSAEDHIINKAYIDECFNAVDKGAEFIGTYDEYFYDYVQDKAVYFEGYTGKRESEITGIGKAYTRSLLEKMNWQMVDDEESVSLDYSNHKILKKITYIGQEGYLSEDHILLDLKNGSTKNSIESMIRIGGEFIINDRIFKNLPKSVVKAIQEL